MNRLRISMWLSSVLLLGGLEGGCGGGGAGETPPVTPTDTTVKSTTPTSAPSSGSSTTTQTKECKPAPAKPYVLHLKAVERADIENAMQNGLAVVSYNCKDLKLITSCHVPGVYGFLGHERKEVALSLKSKDEAEASIPFSGTHLPMQLEQGESLHLTLITVGKTRTTSQGLRAKDLQGSCDGATHIVQGATLGAFTMTTEVTSGTRKKETSVKEGDLQACRSAQPNPNASAPPPDCRAITQLELTPITSP